MTKKSHARLMRDSWDKAQLEELMKIAETTPEERKEIEELIRKFKIK